MLWEKEKERAFEAHIAKYVIHVHFITKPVPNLLFVSVFRLIVGL